LVLFDEKLDNVAEKSGTTARLMILEKGWLEGGGGRAPQGITIGSWKEE